MASPMRLSIAITADASGVRPATEAARAEVQKLGAEAKTTATNLNLQASAEAEAASAARAATAAITGQAAAQQQLRSNVVAINGVAVGAAKGTALAAHEVTNLTRQISDIGVSLASGQSPFMVMIQQGAQIQDVFGRRGVMQILTGLGGAIGSLLTPTTAVLLGITALGYGASAIFEAMRGDVKTLDEALDDQERKVRLIGDAWGYASQKAKEMPVTDGRGGDLIAAASAEQLRLSLQREAEQIVADKILPLGSFFGPDEFISSQFKPFEDALRSLQKTTAAGNPDIAEFRRLVTGRWALDPLNKELTETASKLLDITDASMQAVNAIARLEQMRLARVDAYRQYGMSRVAGPDAKAAQDELEKRQREDRDGPYGNGIPIPTRRPNLEDTLPNAQDFLRTQDETIERIKLEMALIGASEGLRARLIAQLDAEQEIRRRGIDAQGEEAQQLRDNASAIADATTELERHRDAWDQVQSAGENAIDGLVDKFAKGDIKGAIAGLSEDFTKLMLDMAVANPLKNSMFGTNYGTLADAGGLGGIVKRLFGGADAGAETAATSIIGQTVGAMTVNAGSVIITGAIGLAAGGTGGLASNVTRLLTGANDNDPAGRSILLGGAGRPNLPGAGYGNDLAGNIRQLGANIGANPRDIAAMMSYESGLNPNVWGGAGDRYYGLIQAGGPERAQYGIRPGGPLSEQFAGIEAYLKGRGFKPGMSGMDLYSTVNAGSPGRYNASDAGNGGMWGTVADKWTQQMGPHFDRADRLLNSFSDKAAKATDSLGGFDTGITGAVKAITGNGGFDWSSLFSPGFHESGGGFASLIGYGGAGAQPAAGGGGGLLQLLLGFLPSLFGFAEGTRSAPAGLAWVGERGRELINFDGGEQVIPNHQLGNLTGGGSAPTIIFQNNGTPQRLVEQRDEPDGQGGRQTVLVLEDQLTAAMSRQGSSANKHLESRGARMLGPRR